MKKQFTRTLALMLSNDPASAIYTISNSDVESVNRNIASMSKIVVGSSPSVAKRYENDHASGL